MERCSGKEAASRMTARQRDRDTPATVAAAYCASCEEQHCDTLGERGAARGCMCFPSLVKLTAAASDERVTSGASLHSIIKTDYMVVLPKR